MERIEVNATIKSVVEDRDPVTGITAYYYMNIFTKTPEPNKKGVSYTLSAKVPITERQYSQLKEELKKSPQGLERKISIN